MLTNPALFTNESLIRVNVNNTIGIVIVDTTRVNF